LMPIYPVSLGVHPVNLGVHPVNMGVHPVNMGVHPVNLGVHPVNLGVHPVNLGVHPVNLGEPFIVVFFLRVFQKTVVCTSRWRRAFMFVWTLKGKIIRTVVL